MPTSTQSSESSSMSTSNTVFGRCCRSPTSCAGDVRSAPNPSRPRRLESGQRGLVDPQRPQMNEAGQVLEPFDAAIEIELEVTQLRELREWRQVHGVATQLQRLQLGQRTELLDRARALDVDVELGRARFQLRERIA